MIRFCVLALVLLNIDVTRQCALPYWWSRQYHMQPYEYLQPLVQSPGQLVGQPKTTYRYRSVFHRPNPNSYVHVEEYTEYTWYDSSHHKVPQPSVDDIRRMTNVVFSKDGFFNGIHPNGIQPVLPGVTYAGMFPNGIVLPPESGDNSGTNGIVLPGESDDSPDTNGIVLQGESENTNGMVPGESPELGRKGAVPQNDPDFNGVGLQSDSSGIDTAVVDNTDTNGIVPAAAPPATDSPAEAPGTAGVTEGERITLPWPVSTTSDSTPPEATTPRTTTTTTTTASSEIERNEEEVEIVSSSDNSNDLESSSSRLKEPDEDDGFFGGWFERKKNESEPCKVSEADIHSLRSMIEKMFSAPREHLMNPESKEKAREDILNKFRSFGLQVWTQNFTTPPIKHPNGTEDVHEGVNLIGVIPGLQRGHMDDGIVLVGAHYDTVPHSNGVDDNGSGLAVMLEVARALTEARCRLNHTLMFVAFDHEENGAMGSNHFVDHYLIPEELKRARARFQGAFILDGILNFNGLQNTQDMPPDYAESLPGFQYFVNETGNRGDFLAMISRGGLEDSLSTALMDKWRDQHDSKFKLYSLLVDMGQTLPEPDVVIKHANFLRSDHATFWYHNSTAHFPESLNAVLLTDTGPFRGQMKECYHSECDDLTVITPEKLQFAKKTADALTATLVQLTTATGSGNCIQISMMLCGLHVLMMIFLQKIYGNL